MAGTSAQQVLTARSQPPASTHPHSSVSATAHSHTGMEKLSCSDKAMAFVWVMLPLVKLARAQMTQKIPASSFPKGPGIPREI